jgi:hypothetical protein
MWISAQTLRAMLLKDQRHLLCGKKSGRPITVHHEPSPFNAALIAQAASFAKIWSHS